MILFKDIQVTNFDDLYNVAPQAVQQKLNDNKELRENPIHHPELSAFEHIKIVTDRLFDTNDVNLILAGLFHDICKKESAVAREDSEYFLCKDHEKKAVDFTLRHTNFIHSFPGADLGKILWIVNEHMRIKVIQDMRGQKKKELINNIWIKDLVIFSKADRMTIEWNYPLLLTKLEAYKNDPHNLVVSPSIIKNMKKAD
jgi:hypothetical protein